MSGDGVRNSPEGQRILVVEDEMLVALELSEMLKRHGCSIIGPAPDLERAFALIESEPLDAALLDLNLGGKSSATLATALSARSIPFVAVSGYSRDQIRDPEFADVPLVTKPVDYDEILRALEGMTSRAQAAS